MIMKWADADSMADTENMHTVTDRVMTQMNGLDTNHFETDLKNVLVDKATGTINAKVNNGVGKGGIYI